MSTRPLCFWWHVAVIPNLPLLAQITESLLLSIGYLLAFIVKSIQKDDVRFVANQWPIEGNNLRSGHVTHKGVTFWKHVFSCYQCFGGLKDYPVLPSYVFFRLAIYANMVIYLLIWEKPCKIYFLVSQDQNTGEAFRSCW